MIYITAKIKNSYILFLTLFSLAFMENSLVFPALVIDETDTHFSSLTHQEIEKMEKGDRGLVCKQLIENIRLSVATTTITALTSDEKTWHSNDPKGTRSHVVAIDTSIRGAKRDKPTSAIIYLNLNRIDPEISLFKLGTFAELLAQAMELNTGIFSSNYRVRERQTMFFRNAWRDSLGLSQYSSVGNVPTQDYREAKNLGLISEQNRSFFPIINPEKFTIPISTQTSATP